MDDAFAYCEQLVRESDRDRFLATLFAAAAQRPLLYALYAFDLEIASLSTRVREPLAGEVRLQWWREVIEGARVEEVEGHPVARAIRAVIAESGPAEEPLFALLDARGSDFYADSAMTIVDFEAHARDTLGSVLDIAARILGAVDSSNLNKAVRHASLALAYTAAMRRLPSDAARGRLSLPAELLIRFDAQPSDVLAGRATPALGAALREAGSDASGHFALAQNALLELPLPVRPAFLHLGLVPLMLRRLARNIDEPFRPRAEPAAWRRQWTLWRTSRRWLR